MTGVPAPAAGGSGAPGTRGAAGAPGAPGARSARGAGTSGPGTTGPAVSGTSPSGSGVAGASASGPGVSGTGASGAQGPKTPRGGKLIDAAVNQASVWNVANLLTMLRLVLVPGFVALMLADGGYDPVWRAWAWAAFAVAMITDVFDGHLARTYNLVTDFGKIADPIADKAIMGAALICLSYLGDLPWWVTGVILGRGSGSPCCASG